MVWSLKFCLFQLAWSVLHDNRHVEHNRGGVQKRSSFAEDPRSPVGQDHACSSVLLWDDSYRTDSQQVHLICLKLLSVVCSLMSILIRFTSDIDVIDSKISQQLRSFLSCIAMIRWLDLLWQLFVVNMVIMISGTFFVVSIVTPYFLIPLGPILIIYFFLQGTENHDRV